VTVRLPFVIVLLVAYIAALVLLVVLWRVHQGDVAYLQHSHRPIQIIVQQSTAPSLSA
jgi:hypothetical protein